LSHADADNPAQVERPKRGSGSPPVHEAVARAAAGARGVAELTARIATALGTGDPSRDPSVRLWLLRDEGPYESSRHPLEAELPTRDPTLVTHAAGATEPIQLEDGTLVAIRCEGVPLGVLELLGSPEPAAEALAIGSEVIGARLQNLLNSSAQQERLPHVPATDLAAEIDEVVSAFATQAQRLLAHDRLSIYLLTPDGAALERFAVASSPRIPGEQDIQPLQTVGLARVIRTNEAIVSADFGTDERILGEHDSLIAEAGFHGMVSVPLRHRERPFGLLNFVSRTPGFYSDRDVVVAQQIADQVAAFLRDLRQQQTIRESLRRDAVRRERERVAREFHDTLAQSLADISLSAELLNQRLTAEGANGPDEAAHIHETAHASLQEVKRAIFDPVPAELRGSTLASAIRRLLDRFRDETGVTPALETTGELEPLSFELKSVILRVLREALANVRKHAAATSVSVIARNVGGEASLAVEDDGGGFARGQPEGFGISSMREDVEEVAGSLEISSSPEGPTAVRLRIGHQDGVAIRSGRSRSEPSHGSSYPPPVATRVLIVDDHPLFRSGIAELIGREPGMRVIGEVGSGEECLGAFQLLRPDVVLLDLSLPDMSGVEVAASLRDADEPPTVLMMSAFAEGKAVADALDAGARGYISKGTGGPELIEAIRSAVRGATVLNATEWAQISHAGVELSARELQILELLASGARNAQVGDQLHLATKTVEHAVAKIVSKLEARNRTHAVAIAIETGLVSVAGERLDARSGKMQPR
jgi:DNA-binding NarL/FixJ family response regulator/signal transduction histidine kinase